MTSFGLLPSSTKRWTLTGRGRSSVTYERAGQTGPGAATGTVTEPGVIRHREAPKPRIRITGPTATLAAFAPLNSARSGPPGFKSSAGVRESREKSGAEVRSHRLLKVQAGKAKEGAGDVRHDVTESTNFTFEGLARRVAARPNFRWNFRRIPGFAGIHGTL